MINVILDGDGCWPDLQDKMDQIVNIGAVQIATLMEGTVGKNPSVALRFDLPDGTPVIAQVTAREFMGAMKILQSKYRREGIILD